MTDIPIIFSAPMVRALLAGRKTQTRRLAQRKVTFVTEEDEGPQDNVAFVASAWQKVKPGDRLWVRENWRVGSKHDGRKPRHLAPRSMTVMFDAGGSVANGAGGWEHDASWPKQGEKVDWAGKLRPAIFMPRWASRLTLAVTATKIEPVQCISEADSRAEGIICYDATETDDAEYAYEKGGMVFATAAETYEALWRSLHGSDSWQASPEVVALTFVVHEQNIDALKVAA